MNLPRITAVLHRHRGKAIAIAIASSLLVSAIVAMASNGAFIRTRHVVRLDSTGLRFDGDKICEVVVNPKDGMLDFPDSAWEGFYLEPLKSRIGGLDASEKRSIVLELPVPLNWSTLQPIIRTAGAGWIEVVEIRAPGIEPVGIAIAGTPFSHRFDTVLSLFVTVSKDGARSIHLADAGTSTSPHQDPKRRVSDHGFDSLADSIAGSQAVDPRPVHVTIQDLRMDSRKWAGLIQAIHASAPTNLTIHEVTPELAMRVAEHESTNIDTSQESIPDSPTEIRIRGLDRFYFHHMGDANGVIRLVSPYNVLFPQDLAAKPSPADSTLAGDFTMDTREVGIPNVFPGHKLVLREVAVHEFTQKTWSTYWALYENGKRTSVWVHETHPTKMLMNYSIHQILETPEKGIKFRLEGGLFRNNFSEIKGVELEFQRIGNSLVLDAVTSPFTLFPRDEIVTEKRHGDSVEIRTTKNPPRKLLVACGYTDPNWDTSSDEWWTFDWVKLVRSSNCITRSKGTAVQSRSVHQPTFLERGGL